MNKQRNGRRTLINCCECTQQIYTYTAANVDNNAIRCYECCANDKDNLWSPAEVEARRLEQVGPFHKRMAAYNKRRGF